MAAQAQSTKILRIAIIQEGKIVQERLIKAGDNVTVGVSAKNTFVLPKTTLPRPDFPLFVYQNGAYTLCFTEPMKGKVSTGDVVVGLDKLRADPKTTQQAGVWRVHLTEQDRGKVGIDNLTVLFQFVPPPPTQAVKPLQVIDFRPRLMEEDDPVFYGFFAFFSALAAVLVLYVANTEPREITSLDQLPVRFAELAIPPKVENKPTNTPVETASSTKPEDKPEDAPTETADDPNNKPREVTPVDEAKRREALKAEVMQKSLLLNMLTTRGEGKGTAQDLWSGQDSTITTLADALRDGAGGVTIASAGQGTREGSGAGSEDVDIGDLKKAGGGSTSVGSAGDIGVQGSVEAGEGEGELEVGDTAQVKKVVTGNAPQLKFCYEQRLKENPKLQGRVEVEWTLNAGRMTAVSVFANTTGDAALAECIVGKVKRWRFPEEIQGTMSWPFVFKPSS